MNEVFIRIECVSCGIIFGVNSSFNERLHSTGNSFYCTNGHSQVYRVTTEDRLKKELENKQSQIRSLENIIHELNEKKKRSKKK